MSQPDSPSPATFEGRQARARGPGFWVGILAATAAVVGLCWYAPQFLAKGRALLQDFPALQHSVAALAERMSGTEQQLQRWYGEQKDLQAKLNEFRNGIDAKLRGSRKEAQEFAEILYRRATVEMDSRAGRLERQLTQLQSAQESETAKVAALQNQLAELRSQSEELTAQVSALDQNDRSNRGAIAQRLAAMDGRADGAQAELHRFIRSTEPRRVDFELTKHRSQKLAEGVSVCVTDTDVAKRRVDGWMWIMPDRKSIFLRGQGVLQPVVFYSQVDGRRREVVFTSVGKHSAVGYLLLPAPAGRPAAEVARQAPPTG